ncbi:MAG TPA: hypothetical protein VE868_07925 [Balneolaceae bacterium]|nr:hypothetical protein [Balneolaceae bacterium]
MISRKAVKILFIGVVIIIAGLALADAIGVFNPKPYSAVSVGSQVHYVPKDRDPNVKIEKFPTVKPLPSQVITPTGQIVPKDSLKSNKKGK